LSLVISQGKGLNTEGLFGPLPWYLLPEFELFLFSFLVKDPTSKDKRKIDNTMCFLVIFFPRKVEALLSSKYEIEKSLEELFIRKKENRIILESAFLPEIIKESKQIISKAYLSGTKILQEKALDEVISYENVELFALFTMSDKQLKTCLIGQEDSLPKEEFFKADLTDEFQISVREHKNGTSSVIIEFKEIDTIIYVRLHHVIKSHKLIDLLSKIDSSLEILSSYL
jgi:hypothetical protein